MENKKRNRLLKYIGLSLGLHLLFLLFSFFKIGREDEDKAKLADLNVDVVEMSKEDIKRIKKQVVETAKVEKSKEEAKEAFLGEQTQTVQRQTRAKNGQTFVDSRPSQSQGQNGKLPNVKLSDLGVGMNFKPLGHLSPSEQAAATSDHLNVKEGAQTLLNTREFKYFSFYQRVRKQLEQFWEPGLKERLTKMFRRGRQLASDRDHSTKLLVILDATGTITRVKVAGTSGVYDLDQAAIEAFNRAGPFPNPPRGMIENDGTVTIEWEFILRT